MRILSSSGLAAVSSLISLASGSPHCDNLVADSIKWDITALQGPRSVYYIDNKDTTNPSNTTYTFDLCHTLHHHREKDEAGCKRGAWVCGFRRDYYPDTDETNSTIRTAWSIAGTFPDDGHSLEDKYERIKGSSSGSDAEQDLEGIRIHLQGGQIGGMPAKMIASLECDKDAKQSLVKRRSKSENWNIFRRQPEDSKKDDDETDDDEPTGSETTKPEFVAYHAEPIPGDKKENFNWVLRVRWKTVHACEDNAKKTSSGAQGSWGFFTWFIIILFLLAAAYLIFGSWLNYNRHGARGWDLLPHGDTIRDIPYLMKDWGRAIVDTVQGTHSRGGYNQI